MTTPRSHKFNKPLASGLTRRRLRLVLECSIREIDDFRDGRWRRKKQGYACGDEYDCPHFCWNERAMAMIDGMRLVAKGGEVGRWLWAYGSAATTMRYRRRKPLWPVRGGRAGAKAQNLRRHFGGRVRRETSK